ncbi:MAG: FHA domain-containing protein [Candidatus Eremiobacteraeota bacterium]|nr:FHA domain-containing protein [Candidatus Eremiobacteraeota bacterium]
MDPLAIRWISLALVFALAALAVWALADAAREPRVQQSEPDDERPLAVVIYRPGQSTQTVQVNEIVVIGRGRGCHIVFDDATVSKEHARLRVDGRSMSIEDLRSTNGTLVNGRAIDGPTPLRRGDRIAIGPNVIVFAGESRTSES